MKKTIIALAILPTLISVRLNAAKPLPFKSILYNTSDRPHVSVSTEDPQPVYNLYKLAKLLAKKKENYHALAYLTQLSKKRTDNTQLVENLKGFIDYSDINKSTYGELGGLLQITLDIEKPYLNQKVKTGKFEVYKKKLNSTYVSQANVSKDFNEYINRNIENYQEIDALNKLLKKYRNIKIVDSINSFIQENKGLFPSSYKLDDFGAQSLSDFNEKLKDAKVKAIAISNKKNEIDNLGDLTQLENLKLGKLDSIKADLVKVGDGAKVEELFKGDDEYNFLRYKDFYAGLVKKRDGLAADFVAKYIKQLSPAQKNVLDVQPKEDVVAAQQLVVVQAALQVEQQVASGFKIPSESDVIMALAQFMANRAKQETMIWFVQNLQKELQHSLLWDVFPETKKLVEEFDGQSLPDFNETWRLGLSSDFVKLPSNLINGHWLAAKSVENGKDKELGKLKKTVQISNHFYKLIREKQNYRSIIESFYNLIDDNKLLQDSQLRKPIALLHVATNEFFNFNDKKVTFLTTEQIKDLSKEELSILGDLIKLKYGTNVFNDVNSIVSFNVNSLEEEKKSLSKLANFVSDLSQLDVLSKAASSDTSGAFPAVWDKMISMLKYVDSDYSSLGDKFESSNFSEIAQIEDLHKVYQHIARKEFKPAAKAALDLVKPLVSLNNFVVAKEGDKISFKRLKKPTDLISTAIPIFDINAKKISFLNAPTKIFDVVRIQDKGRIEVVNEGKTFSFLIQDLAKEFKAIRFADGDIKLNLNDEHFEKKLKNVKIFMKQLFGIELGSNLKDETPLRFANMLVDFYDDPTKILNKASYEDFKLDDYISHSYVSNKSLNKLVQVSGMFADILTSRDERGIYRAIESVVAPPESYMIKRKNDYTLSINGYVGGFVGYQSVLSKPSDFKSSFIYGITAPIGLTYSQKKWGVFAQFMDLGNAVNHFLWNTSDKIDKQKLTVKELFSPGVSVLYNIPKSPFVLFAGAKMVQIDKRYDANFGMVNAKGLDMLQFTTGLKVDIPFFTLGRWNKIK